MSAAFDIKDLKSRADLVEVARAAGVTLKQKNGEWTGCCPFHQEKTPSFTIYKKAVAQMFKCFGCGEGGDVITFIEKAYRLNTAEALKMLSGKLGSEPVRVNRGVRGEEKETALAAEKSKAERMRRIAVETYQSGSKWHPAVAAYLAGRGIDLDLIGGIPACLRFHDSVYNAESKTKMPCMLAPIYNMRREIIAVHRTYLEIDQTPPSHAKHACLTHAKHGGVAVVRKAKLENAKKTLGNFAGGCIPLYPIEGSGLHIAEGIETALSVRQMAMTGRIKGYHSGGVWTSVSLDNMRNIFIPPQIMTVTIWADNDMAPPEPNKPDLRQRIRDIARMMRLQQPGRMVFIQWPPVGKDFNDVLVEGGAA